MQGLLHQGRRLAFPVPGGQLRQANEGFGQLRVDLKRLAVEPLSLRRIVLGGEQVSPARLEHGVIRGELCQALVNLISFLIACQLGERVRDGSQFERIGIAGDRNRTIEQRGRLAEQRARRRLVAFSFRQSPAHPKRLRC